ncbi:UNVERIFIED_CONTAM: hypothetical protein Sradi_3649600 [Sesamum radiatum]|uniref:Uncharacterized protein n=1 Tax=Sesamum radiatum TaxID=300843 RepID=A0AAW2QIB8_SESRA
MRTPKHDGCLAGIPPNNARTRRPQKSQFHHLKWHVLLRGHALRTEKRRSHLSKPGGQNIPTSTGQEHGGVRGRYARITGGSPSCRRLRRNLCSTKKIPVKAQSREMRIRDQWETISRIDDDPARYRGQSRKNQGHPGYGIPHQHQ